MALLGEDSAFANLDLIHEWQKLRAALTPDMFTHLRETHNLRDHGFFHPNKDYDLRSFSERLLLMMFFWTFTFGEPASWHAPFFAAFDDQLDSHTLRRHNTRVAQEAYILRKRGYTVADAMRSAQASSETPNAFTAKMHLEGTSAGGESSPIDTLGFSPDEHEGTGAARIDPVRAAIKRMARQAEAQRNEQRALGRLLDALAAQAARSPHSTTPGSGTRGGGGGGS